MLDLGFLEDVERILALTPNSRQTALFSATMPPPIRELADRYLYDPVTVKVKSATLTVDSVEQFRVEVKPNDKADKLVEVLRAERPDQAIVFVRTKIRCDQLYRKLRDRGMNVKALHGDMSQGQRDGVMLVVQGRARADPRRHRRRRARPGHLDRHPRRQLRRPDLARTSTCTASGAPAASGARGARSPSSSRASSASSRRSSATSARRSTPWVGGRAHDARAGRRAPAPALQAAALAQRRRAVRDAHRRRRARGRHRGRRPRPRGHRRRRPRRRGRARRPRARALLAAGGAAQRGRPRGRGGRRDAASTARTGSRSLELAPLLSHVRTLPAR